MCVYSTCVLRVGVYMPQTQQVSSVGTGNRWIGHMIQP